MRIVIDYESCWRNSFLDGNNNEPLPKGGRKYIGSMTNLKKPENFIQRSITKDTVMGVINRLIGDQRKLYQARNSENYYFTDIEDLVKFEDKPKVINREMIYIRNITGSTDQNSYTGVIKSNDPILSSDFSRELWGVLALSLVEIIEFHQNDKFLITKDISTDPLDIIDLVEHIQKNYKPLENTGKNYRIVETLNSKFSELVTDKQPQPYLEKSGKIKPINLYAAALYVQLERLEERFNMSNARTKSGKIAGFSKRGFNGKRDFMKNFVTGGEKKIWGGVYAIKEFKSLKPLLTKASGQLEITIDVDRKKGRDIANLIENAGVSSFYLGKKGLAYVSKIRP